MTVASARAGAGPRRGFDSACFKLLIVLLVIACSVTRMPWVLGYSPKHGAMLYSDIPVILAFLAFGLVSKLSDPWRGRNSGSRGVFIPLVLLTLWWTASGLLFARNGELLASSLVQQYAGLAAAIALPGIIASHGLAGFTLNVILWASLAVGLGSIAQVVLDASRLFENPNSSLGSNHAHIGIYMLVVFAVALYRISRKGTWLPGAAAIVAFTVIVISGSRAAQVGSVAILLAYFMVRISFANLVKLALVAAVVGATLVHMVERKQVTNQQDTSFEVGKGVEIDMSSGRRLLMWYVTWQAIQSSPEGFLVGKGFTNYRWEFGKSIRLPFYTNAAHDVYLHVWFETGLLGLLLFVWSLLAPMRKALAERRQRPELAVLAGLISGVLISGITQETLYPNEAFANVNVLFFLVCGIMLLPSQAAERADGKPMAAASREAGVRSG